MKRLFLSSLFKDVADPFVDFAGESLLGKKVAFIPTAAIPDRLDFHVRHSKRLLQKLGLLVDELELSTADGSEIEEKLRRSDMIYVGGGNTFFLLQEINRTGAGDALKAQIESGKLFVGESAGVMILSPDITYGQAMDNPKAAPLLGSYEGLGVVDFYPLPHYRNFPLKKAVDQIIADYAAGLHLVPFGNAQALLVTGTDAKIVSR